MFCINKTFDYLVECHLYVLLSSIILDVLRASPKLNCGIFDSHNFLEFLPSNFYYYYYSLKVHLFCCDFYYLKSIIT